MKLLNVMGLSLTTLAIAIATPFAILETPQGLPTVGVMRAIASTPLLQINDRLDDKKDLLEFDGGNRFVAIHTFDGREGQNLAITLESDDFDTVLMLLDTNGDRIASNDDTSQDNTNSRIDITLPTSGRYTLVVTSYEFEGRGDYRLAVTSQD